MKLYTSILLLILVSCKGIPKKELSNVSTAIDTSRGVEIETPLYSLDNQILELLDDFISQDMNCQYYDSLNTSYLIFYHKNVKPITFTFYSVDSYISKSEDFYGALYYKNHLVLLEGGPIPGLVQITKDTLHTSLKEEKETNYLTLDDSRSQWTYKYHNNSLELIGETPCH